MKYQVLNQEVDMANKIRIWVDTGDGVQMLKFQRQPTILQIRSEVDRFILSRPTRQQELDQVNQQIVQLTERRLFLERQIETR